ncbi:MAG: hypothetical protein ACUZ8E_01475 [Candidatus Anammoxibacter sp.]
MCIILHIDYCCKIISITSGCGVRFLRSAAFADWNALADLQILYLDLQEERPDPRLSLTLHGYHLIGRVGTSLHT